MDWVKRETAWRADLKHGVSVGVWPTDQGDGKFWWMVFAQPSASETHYIAQERLSRCPRYPLDLASTVDPVFSRKARESHGFFRPPKTRDRSEVSGAVYWLDAHN